MARSLLVLGGSAFVGRAAVAEGVELGWDVTTFNRGLTGEADPRARAVVGDRRDVAALARLAGSAWDLVIDTWAGAPRAVRDSAVALADRVERYAYISSVSVYEPPPPLGVSETAATVTAQADADHGDYAECKRGAELALDQVLPGKSIFARAGLILGPRENVGRLTWWLSRIARGGEVLCPGPQDAAIQYIDARDLVRFTIAAASSGQAGAFNLVCPRGHATMESLLDACLTTAGADDAHLTWVDPQTIEQIGIEPWQELPMWLPPRHEYAGMHDVNVDRALDAGLECRPVSDTVSDTWDWLGGLAGSDPPIRPDLPSTGLDADRERRALEAWHRSHR